MFFDDEFLHDALLHGYALQLLLQINEKPRYCAVGDLRGVFKPFGLYEHNRELGCCMYVYDLIRIPGLFRRNKA